MKEDVAGDPISGLRWTRSTTGKIARQLLCMGIQVSASTVGRLLAKMNFSLKTNRKNIESGFQRKPGHHARRNRQFRVINTKRRKFASADLPIISVDGKKRELVGNFKNNGKTWQREPQEVNDHDFPCDAEGVALPYGIYDVRRNTGMVVLGTTRETPAFAVDAIARWWRSSGRRHYPGADELLILADSGGANSSRSRVWKCDLQQKLCNRHGLRVTVCHYPPGASKWNPIEHRLFSEISKNWQGVPLQTYETALNYISTTKTRAGLKVTATLNAKTYQTGERVTDEEMELLKIRTHRTLPEWSYTITPQNRNRLQCM
ncbi:MAG: ISAzo13 family transposase [Burkholderiales bacterium]